MTHRGHRRFALAIAMCVVCVGWFAGATPESKLHSLPTTTATTLQTDSAACQRDPVALDVNASLPNTTNFTAEQAWNIATAYERAYKPAHADPPLGATTGIAVQGWNVTEFANGYLVQLYMIYGGTYNRTVVRRDPLTTPPNATDYTETTPVPETVRVYFDHFYSVYYYVSPMRILRHEQYDRPANPRTGGMLLACQSTTNRTTA